MPRAPNKRDEGVIREFGCRYVPADSRARSVTVTIKAREAEHAFRWFSSFYMPDLPPGEIQIVDERGDVVLVRSWPRES